MDANDNGKFHFTMVNSGLKGLRVTCVFLGNLHLNVTVPEYNKETESLLEPYVFEWLRDCKGSISAEHGVGFHKRNYLHYSRSRAAVDMMKRLKHLLDPRRILNPYKTLPDN